jgi:glycosyltransferase involved in cell wall biosynthesis
MLRSHNEISVETTLVTAAEQARNSEMNPTLSSQESENLPPLDHHSDIAEVESVLGSRDRAITHQEPYSLKEKRPGNHPPVQRPRVLHIDYSGYGVMTHVLSILNYADHAQWEHCVLYATDPARPGVGRYKEELVGTDIRSWSTPVEQWITWGDLPALINTWRIIGKARPDIIHCHSGKAGALGRTAALLRGRIPVVYTPHSFPFQLGQQKSFKRRLLVWLERALGRVSDYITGVSETELQLALHERVIAPDKVCAINNGVDPRKMQAALGKRHLTRTAFHLKEDETVVIFLARMAAQKSPQKVVEAAAALAKKGCHPTFLMVGGGPLEEDCKALARQLGVDSQFQWLGWRPYEEGLLLLAASDMMVLPSRYEGLPFSALEAQAVETVPILSRVSGSSDAIVDGKTGLFVPYGDAEALADTMQELIARPEWRRQLACNGRETVMHCFNAEQMTRSLEEIYDKVLHKRK